MHRQDASEANINGDTDMDISSPPAHLNPIFVNTSLPFSSSSSRNPASPVRFAASANAFGLGHSPASSSSSASVREVGFVPNNDISPGTGGQRKMRRPSMLSLAQTAGGSEDDVPTAMAVQHPSSGHISLPNPFQQPHVSPTLSPTPRWVQGNLLLRRTSSAPPLAIEGLSTHTPPIEMDGGDTDGRSTSPMDVEGEAEVKSPLRWVPLHLQPNASRRKGKTRMDDIDVSPGTAPGPQLHQPPFAGRPLPVSPGTTPGPPLHQPPFTGRPLPAPLLATLISESSPLEHEMRSEARLQRLISSHPHALPLTPRAPRASRGRFPEMVGGDDDDDEFSRRSSWAHHLWTGQAYSSDSDSDEDHAPEPVNSAFAAGMDMDRPGSSSSSVAGMFGGNDSGKSTPGHGNNGIPMSARTLSNSGSGSALNPNFTNQPTPPSNSVQWPGAAVKARMSFSQAGQGMVPSPGNGLGLPGAFGGLGMGNGNGMGTPLASPTIERLELVGSPSGMSVSSPGMMQYRESQGGSASVRPGKRKAQNDDRFDPYKRPRGTSPGLLTSSPAFPMSPSRTTSAIPIPQSPGHATLNPSVLSTSGSFTLRMPTRRPPTGYARSRQASPALSIGSTSEVLSTSLATATGRPSINLGSAFIPTGLQGGMAIVNAANERGNAPGLGGLGLLSLRSTDTVAERDEDEEEAESVEMMRDDSRDSRNAMEED
ncbi:hypothetical protein BCR39DRAFT_600290 [Naematelia encephala]|uniref:Uncharacterized protein n=1 Tax=Naematelia encephala TaxID=71784 RepID=A0A1Y2AR96_9TREE|nr:hypothetical protein BCR39DRAFT_600290 [Naematelia encephala]